VQLLVAKEKTRSWVSVRLEDGSVVRQKETSDAPPAPYRLDTQKLAGVDEAEARDLLSQCNAEIELPGSRLLLGCSEPQDPDRPRWKATLHVVATRKQNAAP
jgi:hypothetical protein